MSDFVNVHTIKRQQRGVGGQKSQNLVNVVCERPLISISSGQQNLMKTYHNEANTSGITKIALKNFLDFFRQSR